MINQKKCPRCGSELHQRQYNPSLFQCYHCNEDWSEQGLEIIYLRGLTKRIEEMTPQELRDIADKKEREAHFNAIDANIKVLSDKREPIKQGFLKHDMYKVIDNNITVHDAGLKECRSNDFELVTSECKQKIVDLFDEQFKLALPHGTRFVCFIEHEQERWYDQGSGYVKGGSIYWAEQHLENFSTLIPNPDKDFLAHVKLS